MERAALNFKTFSSSKSSADALPESSENVQSELVESPGDQRGEQDLDDVHELSLLSLAIVTSDWS